MPSLPESDSWTPCPKGSLDAFADMERKRQWKKRFRKRLRNYVGLGLLFTFVAIGAIFGSLGSSNSTFRNYRYGGITCSRVRQQADSYLAVQLSASMQSKMEEHLQYCPTCRSYIEDRRRIRSNTQSPILRYPNSRFAFTPHVERRIDAGSISIKDGKCLCEFSSEF